MAQQYPFIVINSKVEPLICLVLLVSLSAVDMIWESHTLQWCVRDLVTRMVVFKGVETERSQALDPQRWNLWIRKAICLMILMRTGCYKFRACCLWALLLSNWLEMLCSHGSSYCQRLAWGYATESGRHQRLCNTPKFLHSLWTTN